MIYFLAAKFLREQGRGMTLLISPLLALMRNQVAAAERVGVRCYTINSTNPREWDGIKEKILSGSADFLIVSPERLANDAFRTEILEPITDRIGLLVIDEAHCVSDWGQNNVIKAFAVQGQMPQGGCLLVDDMVDSRWTLTVVAAVLREAGADFVIPLALADSSNEGD